MLTQSRLHVPDTLRRRLYLDKGDHTSFTASQVSHCSLLITLCWLPPPPQHALAEGISVSGGVSGADIPTPADAQADLLALASSLILPPSAAAAGGGTAAAASAPLLTARQTERLLRAVDGLWERSPAKSPEKAAALALVARRAPRSGYTLLLNCMHKRRAPE